MKSYTVPAKLLKAASVFQADSMEIRYYLQGIYLDKENSRVVGTNGHFMFIGNDESFGELPCSGIIRVMGNIPASAEKAQLVALSKTSGYISFLRGDGKPVESKGFPVRLFFQIIDGKFPDIDKAIPRGPIKPVDSIGVNCDYFGKIGKAKRALGDRYGIVKTIFRDQSSAIEIDMQSESYDVKVVLMPCRVYGD